MAFVFLGEITVLPLVEEYYLRIMFDQQGELQTLFENGGRLGGHRFHRGEGVRDAGGPVQPRPHNRHADLPSHQAPPQSGSGHHS